MQRGKSKFQLEFRVDIRRIEEDGRWTNEQLSVSDQVPLGVMSFMQVSQVLGRLHEAVLGIAGITADETEDGGQ